MSDLDEKLRALHDALPDGGEGCLDWVDLKHKAGCSVIDALHAASAIGAAEGRATVVEQNNESFKAATERADKAEEHHRRVVKERAQIGRRLQDFVDESQLLSRRLETSEQLRTGLAAAVDRARRRARCWKALAKRYRAEVGRLLTFAKEVAAFDSKCCSCAEGMAEDARAVLDAAAGIRGGG